MILSGRNIPPGIRILRSLHTRCCPRLFLNRDFCYRTSVLLLTYIAYTCYHLSRKPISVVKTVLHQNCQNLTPPVDIPPNHITKWCDWAPFDGSDSEASHLLGSLDSAFLFAYAAAMFASGFIAERTNLRYFLALGMLGSGAFSYLFGIARPYGIHSMMYFITVQAFAGIFQTTGWPGVVAVLGNWFGKEKRGLLFGIWNSHTSVGNILGSLVAAEFVEGDWSLSFIVPGVIIAAGGILLLLFLTVDPRDVGATVPEHARSNNKYRRLENRVANRDSNDSACDNSDTSEVVIVGDQEDVQRRATERSPMLRNERNQTQPHARERVVQPIGFIGACKIPGVVEFSLALFFAKLVSYTFLYWLPIYIKASTTLGPKYSADLSTLFDVGGIIGAIVAGVASDWSGAPASTCAAMLAASVPSLLLYERYGAHGIGVGIPLLVVSGALVNGPYALITTAVAAELGTHSSLGGNSRALATVTAIIDGTGSIGAAVGPQLAAYVGARGWKNVFYVLMGAELLALLLLARLVKQELFRRYRRNAPA